jgi:hypothetical protein
MTAGPEGECLRRATRDRARDQSRIAETLGGSVHASPVSDQRTRPTLKTGPPSPGCIIKDLRDANSKIQLRIDYKRKLLGIILTKNIIWGAANTLEPIARDARAQATAPHQDM